MQDSLERIMQQFEADTGTIHIVEDDLLVLKAHVGIPQSVLPVIAQVPIGKGMAGTAVQSNTAVASCDIQVDQSRTIQAGARHTGVNGAIVVPIRDDRGRAIGALGIGVYREHVYSDAEVSRLVMAASAIMTDRAAVA